MTTLRMRAKPDANALRRVGNPSPQRMMCKWAARLLTRPASRLETLSVRSLRALSLLLRTTSLSQTDTTFSRALRVHRDNEVGGMEIGRDAGRSVLSRCTSLKDECLGCADGDRCCCVLL